MPLIIKVLDFIAGTLLLSGWWTGPLFSIWRYIYIINLVFKNVLLLQIIVMSLSPLYLIIVWNDTEVHFQNSLKLHVKVARKRRFRFWVSREFWCWKMNRDWYYVLWRDNEKRTRISGVFENVLVYNYFYLKKIAKVILAHFSKIAYLSFLWEELLLLIMFIMPGEKQMVTWWRGYLVVVSQDNKQLQRPAVG